MQVSYSCFSSRLTLVETYDIIRLCNETVTHDRTKLDIHFQRRHPAVTLDEYYKLHVASRKRPAPSDRDPVEAPADEKRAWYDGCVYKCDFCPLETAFRGHMTTHLKGYHKKKDLEKGEGFAVVREGSIECRMCGISMVQNAAEIKKHLNRFHKGVSFVDYERRHVQVCRRSHLSHAK